jgi:biotin synthase
MRCDSQFCARLTPEPLQVVKYHILLRTIATARIVLPTTIIRLAAGRNTLAESEQAMCFMAGANAVFTGEQMLTTPCLYSLSNFFFTS